MSESEYSPAASPDVALRELGVRASELRDAVRKAAATGSDRELVLRLRAIVLELDRLIETLATFASGGSQPDTQVLVHDLLQLTRNAVGLEPAKDVGELETLVRQLGAAVQRYSRAEPATKKTAKAWGTIKWFNARKGFGFITPDGGGEDLFIHTSSISSPGFRVLKEGDRVQFEVTQGPKSKRGSNIQAMDSGNVSPRLEKDKRSKGKRFGTEVEAAKKKGPQGNEQPRWILAQVFDLSAGEPKEPTRAIHAGARHEIHVIIGAAQKDWLVAQGRNAAQSIDSMLSEGTHELTVVFFMPNLGTRTGKLTLPSSGPTPKPAIFRFRAGSAGSLIEALISIVHRGRVLQTALLSGRAVADPLRAQKNARITLRLQVVVPGFADLNARESFDAALVTASTANKRAVAAGVVHAATGSDKTVYFNQPRIEGAARNIRDLLEAVVTDDSLKRKLDSDAARNLLWKLAQEGRLLYELVGERLTRELPGHDLSRLQLVQTDPGAFIPIEFVYDLSPPANGAGLCKNWKAALAGSPCTADQHKQNVLGHLEVVCPSGFWGVKKVIERQILKDVTPEDMRKGDFGVRTEPTAKRPNLPRMGSALFAWSEILDNTVPGTSVSVLKSLNRATGDQAASAKTWIQWVKGIRSRHPTLLVLLSHTVNKALEIGPEESGERATVAQINTRFVKKVSKDAPIVFLLGCDTAVAEDELFSFVGRFRDQGAALVVGTITPVLGERAAAVVEAVVGKLAQKRPRPQAFGELMRDSRCELLSKGELTALCATSFGDATWLVS